MAHNEALQSEKKLRIGAVRYFNSRPLIHGLAGRADVSLSRDVPSKLAAALDNGQIDVGLVPGIDYQRSRGDWWILPAGAVSSCGEVLTVRVFSRCRMDEVQVLACDSDSHCSAALAQIIWKKRYKYRPRFTTFSYDVGRKLEVGDKTAALLIGDKVLSQLGHWPYELDLGQVWWELTGLPFVYAIWAVKDKTNADHITEVLSDACENGIANIDDIARDYGPEHGFTPERAAGYLRDNIGHRFGPDQQKGLQRFYELSLEYGLIDKLKPLRIFHSSNSLAMGVL